MTKLDQFESAFRAAIKPLFHYRELHFKRILIITDLRESEAQSFVEQIKRFANVIHLDRSVEWLFLYGGDFDTTQILLDKIKQLNVDLIFTYRNLHSNAWKYPHSLGEYLDVMIQLIHIPIVVLPNPKAGYADAHALKDTNVVMAMTNHLAGNQDLINYAVRFVEEDGKLILVHIENADTFDYYMSAISKIAGIETTEAKTKIAQQLLKEPSQYITSIRESLIPKYANLTIEEIVKFGHQLTEYRDQINHHKVDLLVLDSQDPQQAAMYSMAYPLAIEFRHIPLMLI